MFKAEKFENELMQQMERNLVLNEKENRWSFDKIAKAAEYISFAAEIFDDTGMHKEAEMLTRMLEKMASAESNRLVGNMKATGTPFSMGEYGDKNKATDPFDMKVEGIEEVDEPDQGEEEDEEDGEKEDEFDVSFTDDQDFEDEEEV